MTAIDELTSENELVPAADLYGYFTGGGSSLFDCSACNGRTTDNLHPNDTGLAGMNARWSEALRAIYP